MKNLVLIAILLLCSQIQAQENLAYYSLEQLDSIYKQKDKEKKKQELLPYALAMLEKGKEKLDRKDTAYAKILYKTGQGYFFRNRADSALFYYQETRAILKTKAPKHIDYANALNGTAIVYNGLGDLAEANLLFREVLALRKEILGAKHPSYASSLNNLALSYRNMGNYTAAEPIYLESLKLKKEVLGEKHPDYANSLNGLAVLYMDMGNYGAAEAMYLQAIQIRKEVLGEKNSDYASSLNNLGILYWHMGNYSVAEPLLQQALQIKKETLGEKHTEYANSLNSLAVLYMVTGDNDLAESLYQEVIKINKELFGEKHFEHANSLNNLAIVYRNKKNYSESERLFQEALNIFKETMGETHPIYINCLNTLAALYRDMENYTEAETIFLHTLSQTKKNLGERHNHYAIGLKNLAIVYMDMGNYTTVVPFLQEALNINTANLSLNFAWLSQKEKNAYWYKEKDFYQKLNNFAALANDIPAAAELAYQGNLIAKSLLLETSRELEEAIAQSTDSLAVQIYTTIKEKRRLHAHLFSSGTATKATLDKIEQEADSLDKVLVGRMGAYTTSKRKFEITWREVQAKLAPDEVAIEFAQYQLPQEGDSINYYLALILRPNYDAPKIVKLCTEKELQAIPAGKGFADLYKLIWEPIDSFLVGVEKVYYCPDGYLNNISFAALCSKGTEQVINTKDIKRGGTIRTATQTIHCNYLSDKYTLHQLSTSRYLAEGLKTSKVDNSMLVFGGVNYDEIPSTGDTLAAVQFIDMEDYVLAENISRSSTNQSRMAYLPGTQTELLSLQKILSKKQWNVRAYSDKNASENTLKTEIQQESTSVLHIATHGFAFPNTTAEKNTDNKTYRDANNPMARCGLLLAGANHSWTGNSKNVLAQTGEDGILTALEVSNLPLKNTKLVVLSACETGLGKIEGTEGTFGLKRGFKLAGVEQLVVSLWSVPDEETMELMEIFYNDLAKTHDAVVSFEKAQKTMRQKYADRPDLWAGFVLVR